MDSQARIFSTHSTNLLATYAEAIQQRQLDVFVFPAVTLPDTLAVYRLPKPAFTIRSVIYSQQIISDWQELKGLRGGYYSVSQQATIGGASPFHQYAKQHLDMQPYPTNEDCVNAFVRGDIDYMVGLEQPIKALLRLTSPTLVYHIHPEPLISIPVHLHIANNSPLLMQANAIESLIEEQRQSGHRELMLKRAMNSFIHYQQRLKKTPPALQSN
ncbi:hypothetical protein [Oceanicoccus sp. KOV_DT_Chl]|uniref:substrate-binding periplasmic protein n=1 Tax=Oceanicoccus sp. KOV_DT_Chl TaxID=1904639 RepID=UPI000C7D5C8F